MLQLTPETVKYLRDFRNQLDEREIRREIRKAIERTRQLSEKKFAGLVEVVKPILASGEPTKFQFEGTCRYAVRVRLLSVGFSWRDADANAMAVVGAALKELGVTRPSWMQGQPEWRDRDASHWRYRHCCTCGGMLDEDQKGRHCSTECAGVTAKKRWQKDNREKMSVLQKAWRTANPDKRKAATARSIERADPRDCKQCGSTFKVPNSKASEFCQPRCYYDWRKAFSAKKNEKQCGYCGGLFVARSRVRHNYYCSKACGFAAKKRGATIIFQCEEALNG
jgi:predicted nucleic acid-binding Zn ribbon protein/uncharacterized Zn-finger protein